MLILAIDRPINFVIAASSTQNAFLKYFLKLAKIIPTVRPIDHRKKCAGLILSHESSVLIGHETVFKESFKPGDSVRINGIKYEFAVIEVIDNTHVKVKIPNELESPTNEIDSKWTTFIINKSFDCLPKVDQGVVHKKTIETLERNEVVGIFPEGGSHDQTQLLPLKAGVCIFLWSAHEKGINPGLICVGVNYYGSHKFRSKVVVNIGVCENIVPDPTRLEDKKYKYEYISTNLDHLKSSMEAVKINTTSYEKLVTLNFAKEIYIDKETKMDPKLDFLILKKFCSGFELISKHQKAQELLSKMNDFRKKVKRNGLKVKDLKNYDIFLKKNLILLSINFIGFCILVF